jgi:hypothetical protein
MSAGDWQDMARQARREAAASREEAERYKAEYEHACKTVAQMHFAATGSLDGPRLGVVEDVAAVATELERERMRLVACGVVAMADTPDSAAKARDMHPDYRSASCDDVARRVDECMALRKDAERLDWFGEHPDAVKRASGYRSSVDSWVVRHADGVAHDFASLRHAIDFARAQEVL